MIDTANTIRPFVLIIQKGTGLISHLFAVNPSDKLEVSFLTVGNNLSGCITSDKFKALCAVEPNLHWRGDSRPKCQPLIQ